MDEFDLSRHGIGVKTVLRNVSPSGLYEEAIRYDKGTTLSDTGCLIAYSGDKTGRSPKDKRVSSIRRASTTSGGDRSISRWMKTRS